MGKVREKDLYPAITRRMQKLGYLVEGAAVGRDFVLPFTAQSADLIGFRWGRSDDVEVWGVEVKRGEKRSTIREALAQAAAYQVVVPRVSIATRAHGQDLRAIEGNLRALGLGYLHLQGKSAAHERIAPKDSPAPHVRALFERSLRHAALLLLLSTGRRLRDLPGPWRTHASVWPRGGWARPVQSGHESQWSFGTHSVDVVEIMLHVDRADGQPKASVWIESRPALKKLAAAVDPASLRNLLRATPLRVSIRDRVNRRAPKQVARKAGQPVYFNGGLRVAEGALAKIRKILAKPQHIPVLAVSAKLWDAADSKISRARAEQSVERALSLLMPIRAYFRQCLGA